MIRPLSFSSYPKNGGIIIVFQPCGHFINLTSDELNEHQKLESTIEWLKEQVSICWECLFLQSF